MISQSAQYVTLVMSYDCGTLETNNLRKMHLQFYFSYVMCFNKHAITLEKTHFAMQVIYQMVAYEM